MDSSIMANGEQMRRAINASQKAVAEHGWKDSEPEQVTLAGIGFLAERIDKGFSDLAGAIRAQTDKLSESNEVRLNLFNKKLIGVVTILATLLGAVLQGLIM